MLEESKDPWEIVAKVGGLGALAVIIRELIRSKWPSKEKVIDAEALFTEKLLKRIEKLEGDIDEIHTEYERRMDLLRAELAACRKECAQLAADAGLLGRFIPPRKAE